MKLTNQNISVAMLAFFAGATLTLAFAPFSIWPLAICSPAAILYIWFKSTIKQAFYRGFLYGLGLFSTGIYWIYNSVYVYGHTSIWLALIITAGLIHILALFPALTGYLLNRYFPLNNGYKIFLAFPSIWVLLEWTRSWISTGFPWLSLGYSQINSPLKGYAPILSVYLVSLMTLFCSSLLLRFILLISTKRRRAIWHLGGLVSILITGGALSLITWTKPLSPAVTVSLVQGNIAQELKWSPDKVLSAIQQYVSLSEPYWQKSKIIIWPETAIPMTLQDGQEIVDNLSLQAKQSHTGLITGIPVEAVSADQYYNAVVALGEDEGFYLKHRLVPFGEYTPLPWIFHKLLDGLHIPMSQFVPDRKRPKPLTVAGIKIATFICFEIAFAEQVLNQDKDIGMLLTVNNDGWFGRSIALAQHLEMAQMRSLELGRPLLFVSNTGITAIVNHKGNIQSQAPIFKEYVLTDKTQPRSGLTPWQRLGLDPLIVLLIAMLIAAIKFRQSNVRT